MLHLDENTHLIEKILDAAPQTLERIQQMFKKNNKNQGQGQNQNQMNNMNY